MGKWVTINGAHVFLKDGQSPMDAFIRQSTESSSKKTNLSKDERKNEYVKTIRENINSIKDIVDGMGDKYFSVKYYNTDDEDFRKGFFEAFDVTKKDYTEWSKINSEKYRNIKNQMQTNAMADYLSRSGVNTRSKTYANYSKGFETGVNIVNRLKDEIYYEQKNQDFTNYLDQLKQKRG